MMILKRNHFLTLVCIVGMVMVFDAAEAAIELTMVTHWSLTSPQGKALNDYVEEYNALNPDVTIVLDSRSYPIDTLMMWFAAGVAPDIIPISQALMPNLISAGVLDPLTNEQKQPILEAYVPGALQLVTFHDELWGYPTECMPQLFKYNTYVFEQSGVVPGIPNTWDELVDLASKLTTLAADGTVKVSGLGIDLNWRAPVSMWMSMVWSDGGEVFCAETGEFHFTDTVQVKALEFMQDLCVRGVAQIGWNHPFRADTQAIRWTPGPFRKSELVSDRGEEWYKQIYSDLPPAGITGETFVPFYGWNIVIPNTTENPEAAHEFVLWLTTDVTEDGTTRMGNIMALLGSIPVTTADISNQSIIEENFMRGFVTAIAEGRTRSWPTPMNSVSIFEMLHGEMLEVLKGNTSAQSALQRAEKKARLIVEDALN